VFVYHKEKQVAVHHRNWKKKERVQLPSHREQVKKLKKRLLLDRQMMIFMSLGQEAVDFLEKLSQASQPVKKTVNRLLDLKDQYGTSSLIVALRKALEHKLYGADYVQNILHQHRTPTMEHQPLKLKNKDLNDIRLAAPNLAEYDAVVMKRKKQDG